jgi:putative FmdB family regulatory protein
MPIYEYKCAKCGKTIEVIQKMSDKPLKKHEQCGGTLTKLISAAGFQFKGTGWYVTDYGRKSSGESKETATDKKTESKETSSNGSKEGSSSGSASAAKAEGGKGKAEKSGTSKSGSKKD